MVLSGGPASASSTGLSCSHVSTETPPHTKCTQLHTHTNTRTNTAAYLPVHTCTHTCTPRLTSAHTCTRTHTDLHSCTQLHTHTHTHTHTCTHLRTHPCTPLHTPTRALTFIHTPIRALTLIHTPTHALICAHTPAHTSAHTHTCTHTHMLTPAHTVHMAAVTCTHTCTLTPTPVHSSVHTPLHTLTPTHTPGPGAGRPALTASPPPTAAPSWRATSSSSCTPSATSAAPTTSCTSCWTASAAPCPGIPGSRARTAVERGVQMGQERLLMPTVGRSRVGQRRWGPHGLGDVRGIPRASAGRQAQHRRAWWAVLDVLSPSLSWPVLAPRLPHKLRLGALGGDSQRPCPRLLHPHSPPHRSGRLPNLGAGWRGRWLQRPLSCPGGRAAWGEA